MNCNIQFIFLLFNLTISNKLFLYITNIFHKLIITLFLPPEQSSILAHSQLLTNIFLNVPTSYIKSRIFYEKWTEKWTRFTFWWTLNWTQFTFWPRELERKIVNFSGKWTGTELSSHFRWTSNSLVTHCKSNSWHNLTPYALEIDECMQKTGQSPNPLNLLWGRPIFWNFWPLPSPCHRFY